MGVRKNYRDLTDVERDRFVRALDQAKSTGVVDRFAEMHERHFSHGIHRSSHFLPWHREMILRFERELQKFHPDVTLPYWDSTVDRSPSDPLWNDDFLGQFNSAWGLRRALGSGPLSTLQDVERNRSRDNYNAFWRELESPIHNRPHVWVGGVMSSAASPGDPVFYLHHCWIDLLWARWQFAHPGPSFESSGPGAGLNDAMMEWPDRTPANVLDHRALGYTYDIEVPPAPRWVSLEGTATSDPGAVLQTGGRLVVFVRGSDNTIWHRWQITRNGDWSGWESIGAPPGGATSGPDAALNAPGGLVVFARGEDNAVWHAWQDKPDGSWSSWASLEGTATSDPGAVLQTGGRLVVFVRGSDNTIWHRWQITHNGDWSGWESIGAPPGGATSGPDAALNASGGLVVFARGGNNDVWHTWQDRPDGDWSGWAPLEGAALSDPGAVLQTGGRLVVFVRGSDNTIWHRWQITHNGDWSGWESIGAPPGGATSGPDAALNAPGGLVVFARDKDNVVWHAWQDRPDGNWW
jgi:tyrosinase-like protein